ncbi:MAG: sugar ABC transporter permease [Clostridia bacterium]|nr:sugar ABC transporter permease [Clostridia bacterium]
MKFWHRIKKDYLGILFVLPVIAGLACFTFVPMGKSLINSFQTTDFYTRETAFSLENYAKIFDGGNTIFRNSLLQTLLFTVIDIPLRMVLSFSLALFLFKEIKGVKLVRVLCYVPVIIPTVVSGLLWRTIMASDTGYLNLLLTEIGFDKLTFFDSNDTALMTFIFVGMFGIGSSMILWISQLKNIPTTVYEAAEIEGANRFQALFKITVPLCGPTIFYVLITNIIGTLQVFDLAYMFKNPLNDKAINFLVVYIYQQAFGFMDMGYACALSWILFAIIAVLSGIVFVCKKWVIYGEDYV